MMRVSTKGRYALRMMIDLARIGEDLPVALRDIAKRQQIPIKYTENIMAMLLRAGMVKSTRGKAGGYRLQKAPSEYIVYDIIAAAEGNLAPVQCLDADSPACPMQEQCATLPIWQGLDEAVRNYLSSFTLEDVCKSDKESGPCLGEK
ncbi:MAG: RrF2 family transcriptional regulator [Akkermansia sp.]|nr:RrF2 family transcriptional regulator [Akkermansia sp.]